MGEIPRQIEARMKIAITSMGDISSNDGTSVRAKRVFELLRKKYDCRLIIRGKHDSKSENVEIIRPSKLYNFQLIPVVLKSRFDLIYCSNDFWGFLTYFALAKLHSYKIVFEAHGIQLFEKECGLPNPGRMDKIRIATCKWREEFALKHADCVIVLSSDIFTYCQKFNKRIFLIPVFVDEKKFKPQESSNQRKRDRKEQRVVGLIGPFIKGRRNNYFLDFIYKDIGKFDERITVIIIGECSYRIKNERISYTGYLNDVEDYINQLALLDAVLVPMELPTFGPLNKILEPMACSVPVFTTPVGAVGLDHVKSEKDIFICDEAKLVAKVNESLFDVDLMERVGKEARRTIETYYSATANNTKLINVIEQVDVLH
ncbi:MAG: glycosyltransferase family 4 protein [Halobacteriota archaeon]